MEVVKPSSFSWLVENEIAGMARPYSLADFRFLMQEGIKHLVSLNRKPANIHALSEISCTEIRIPDLEAPSISQIEQFINLCEMAREKKEPVCVHCFHGRGRTGVMLACYLVRFCDLCPDEAIARVRILRRGSVETEEQYRVIFLYAYHLHNKNHLCD